MHNTYLAKALQSEDIVVKLGERLYIPGVLQSGAKPGINIEGCVFGLEGCSAIQDMGMLFFQKHPDFVKKYFDSVFGDENLEKRILHQYSKNWVLQVVVDTLDMLREQVYYQQHFDCSEFEPHYPADLDGVEEAGAVDLGDFTGLVDYRNIVRRSGAVFPRDALFIGDLAYELKRKKSGMNIHVVNPSGVKYWPVFKDNTTNLAVLYENKLEERLQQNIEGIDTQGIEGALKAQYCSLWGRIKQEDFAADGLLIRDLRIGEHKKINEKGEETDEIVTSADVDVVMILPRMAMKIPREEDYILFEQAELLLRFQKHLKSKSTTCNPVEYYSESLHPIVYMKDYYGERLVRGKENQVCIRQLGDDMIADENAPLSVQLGYIMLAAREMVMYATNLTNRFDSELSTAIAAVVAGNRGNWHRLADKRLNKQRVSEDFVRKNNIMVIGAD